MKSKAKTKLQLKKELDEIDFYERELKLVNSELKKEPNEISVMFNRKALLFHKDFIESVLRQLKKGNF